MTVLIFVSFVLFLEIQLLSLKLQKISVVSIVKHCAGVTIFCYDFCYVYLFIFILYLCQLLIGTSYFCVEIDERWNRLAWEF